MACTFLRIFGLKKWHDKRFGDLCNIHDDAYRYLTVPKTEADFQFCLGVCRRKYAFLAVLYLFGLQIFGWIFWVKNRIKYRNWPKR